MEAETVYFEEEVKGHKLLITSRFVSFLGKELKTPDVDLLSVLEFRQSINAIPASARYRLCLGTKQNIITIDCTRVGGLFGLGAGQFRRVKQAALSAVAQRLFSVALKTLASGEPLVFENSGFSLEKKMIFTLSHQGIEITQNGVLLSKKTFLIRWEHLRVSKTNGTIYFQCYSSGKKATVSLWRMPNNVIFESLLDFLMDKANYRMLKI